MTLLVLTFLIDISIQYARNHFIDIHHSSLSQYHPIISYTNSAQQYLHRQSDIYHIILVVTLIKVISKL